MTTGPATGTPSGSDDPRWLRRGRRLLGRLLGLAVLGFAIHVLLPQVAEIRQGLQALTTGRWIWLAPAVIASGLTYVAGGWMVRASVDRRPPMLRTAMVQMAASTGAVVTPMGLGWVGINEAFLEREGTGRATSQAATGLTMVLSAVSHVGLLVLLLPLLPSLRIPAVAPPQRRIFIDLTVLLALVGGAIISIPRFRRWAGSVLAPVLRATPGVVRDPRRSAVMVAAAVTSNLAYGASLYASVAAFGPVATPVGVLVAYLIAATVATIAPTPGGLGAMESALVAALSRLGVAGGQAVAATLAFRLATFWIPLAAGALILRVARRRGWV